MAWTPVAQFHSVLRAPVMQSVIVYKSCNKESDNKTHLLFVILTHNIRVKPGMNYGLF